MASDRWHHLKRDTAPEYIKDMRLQLSEQMRSLDLRVDTQSAIISELQEYFRRRAEVELDYSRGLDKLHRSLTQRHKDIRHKREQIHLFSSYSCWQQLMASTRQESRDRAVLGDVLANLVTQRLGRVGEDLQRIYKQCRAISAQSHEDLLEMLHDLQTATKTYNTYYGQFTVTQAKLQRFLNEKAKLQTNIPHEKLEKCRKFRLMQKEEAKRRDKFEESRVKAVRARNDLILALEANNASVRRFFVDDISDVVDCIDIGFHAGLERALSMCCSGVDTVTTSARDGLGGLQRCMAGLDSLQDKQKFIEANNSVFMLPKRMEFMPHKSDELPAGQVHRYQVDPDFSEDFQRHYAAINERITALRFSTEEMWKTMEEAEKTIIETINDDFVDCLPMFDTQKQQNQLASSTQSVSPTGSSLSRPADSSSLKQSAGRQEIEKFYTEKFQQYISNSNMVARLQAKYEAMQAGCGELPQSPTNSEANSAGVQSSKLPVTASLSASENRASLKMSEGGAGGMRKRLMRRRRIGRVPTSCNVKLFGGSLEEYLETSGEEIPTVIQSCVRVINQYGLHHQGIFRVSGSQVEINSLRDSFERGEDPLADITDSSDINSVAGLLKLYLREIREPLFPTLYFEQFMEIAQLHSSDEKTTRIAEVVRGLSRSVFIVMRYLFAFLNHVSEFSDENMMDPYNLAVCFGPTLLPIPDKTQMQYHALVNELVSQIILRHDEIFPRDGGPVYDKYITRQMDVTDDIGEAPSDVASTVDDPGDAVSEDDSVFKEKDISLHIFGKSEQLEAVAQHDFKARSPRELSLQWGDVVTLYRQISSDWWWGSKGGQEGLVPDKYVLLKIRDEDRTFSSEIGIQSQCDVDIDGDTSLPAADKTFSSEASASTNQSAEQSLDSEASVVCSVTSSPLPRPELMHSVSACDSVPALRRSSLLGGSWKRGRFASARDSSLSAENESAERTSAAVGDKPLAGGDDEEGATGGAGADPEVDTRRLDRAMRQIELVTETLRAAETECESSENATAEEEEEEVEVRAPVRISPGQRVDSGARAAVVITAAQRAPSEQQRHQTVCSVWETRRSPERVDANVSSVRSRRAMWETICSGGSSGSTDGGDSALRAETRTRSASGDSESPTAVRLKKHTPDLVRDLPPASGAPAGASSGSEEEPVTVIVAGPQSGPPNGAEAFARQNQVTIRRGGRNTPPPIPAVPASVASVQPPRLTRRPLVVVKPKLSPELPKKRPGN